ncbi:hypothetical protein K3495_g2993 [Podosphaera aphanis]|nr:hypothetical protein K3495_g2993 [Podosphaera aphanis]
MHDNETHPILAQVPLTVSPFISLPTATTLPYTYKKLPASLPVSLVDPSDRQDKQERMKYVVSATGFAAHPEEIRASCRALKNYVEKALEDADKELKDWEADVAARELAEKRKVAPGWLDSDARILEPERSKHESTSTGDSNNEDAEVVMPSKEGDELDRAFGGLVINKE